MTTTAMVRLAVCGALLAAAGCGKAGDDEFEGSTPTKDTVALELPSSTANAPATARAGGLSVRGGALLGDVAKDYLLTATVVGVVNGAAASILNLVRDITDFPPTTISGDTAVWGPATAALSANTYRLTVTRTAPHVFTYQLDGKGKNAPDTAFVTVLSGTHTRALDASGNVMKGFGSGDFTLDFDAAATLPQHDDGVGQIAFQYSRTSPTATTTIGVTFAGVQDHCDPTTCQTSGQIFDAVYAYTATPGDGGDLQYADMKDYLPASSAKETLELHSRWLQTGTGRTDMQLSGGDVGAAAQTSSECWDANFLSVYSGTTYDPTLDWGVESSCPFSTAAYASLAVQ